MKWLAASLVVLAFSAGCHAPKPSFNVLAPYGSPRVPPPGTSGPAVGTGTTYYNQPGGVPAASAPAKATSPAAGQRTDTANPSHNPSLASSDPWRSVQLKSAPGSASRASSTAGNVALTSFDSIASGGSSRSSAHGQDASSLRQGGMPVNDATQTPAATPPAVFVPAASASPISSLPAPPTVSSTNTVVATGQASDQAKSGSSDNAPGGQSTLQWRTRY